jgi:hypothetical protein
MEVQTMNIAERLRTEIERLGVYRVAKDAGININVVSRFVKCEHDLSLANADKLAEFLGLELKAKKKGGR